MVKNKLFRLSTPLSETQLQLLGTLLNTSFTGLTLEELGPELARVASHAGGEAYGLISLVAVSYTHLVISPVGKLRYKDDVMVIGNGEIGPLSQKLYDTVTGIQLGRLEDKFGWRVRVD